MLDHSANRRVDNLASDLRLDSIADLKLVGRRRLRHEQILRRFRPRWPSAIDLLHEECGITYRLLDGGDFPGAWLIVTVSELPGG